MMTCWIGDCFDYEQEDGGAGEPAAETAKEVCDRLALIASGE
jgi:hypothetical protein